MTLATEYTHNGSYIVTDYDAPDSRFIVWQDDDAEDPRSWQDDETVQTLTYAASSRGRSDGAGDTATPLMRAFFRHYDETGDDAAALTFTQRFARAYAPGWQIATYSASGYSQSDWWEVVTVTAPDAGEPDGYSATWEQWARGDVFNVMRETFTPCETPDTCHAGEDDHWTPTTDTGADSLIVGGIYADDAEDVVLQYLAMGE